jgi:hypothetical protein
MWSSFRESSGYSIRRHQVSDEDRNKRFGNDEGEDVKAHIKSGREAIEDESGDDVEAHVKSGREAVKSGREAVEDEGGDDVEAHIKSGRE